MIFYGVTITTSHYVFLAGGFLLGLLTSLLFIYLFYRKRKSKKYLSIRGQLKEAYINLKEAGDKIRELDELFYTIERDGR